MSEKPQKDDALFDALGKQKKKRRRKIIRTIIIVVLVLVIALVAGVSILQRRVREQFASSSTEVLSYEASTGTISTVVSGSGTLTNVDTEEITVPSGVELREILVGVNDAVEEGDILATVDMATVRSAMADLQSQIDDLDEQISDAEGDKVSSYIKAGVSGRVKILYAEKGDSVASVMAQNGALAVISLDGYMALDLQNDQLAMGDSVTVRLSDGTEVTGSVESSVAGTATILITDNGPQYDEEVMVLSADGAELGTASLYIHNPLAVTGYAGTISRVGVSENSKVSASSNVFYLSDTASSANYDALLRERKEIEETLLELLAIQRSGGVAAPISGSVYTVTNLETDSSATTVATLSPDVSMSVTISVDESDILSLELGQEADVTVSSVSEDTFTGTVTEINKTASDGAYTAVITLDRSEGMLPGMTASVDVRIEGVDNAILIPVDALHQTADTAYVYTTYDEETQEYGGKIDVEVGLANDNYVEIKSGLSEGDTVYYTESESFADLFGNMGGFGNRGSQSGGEMPGGDFSGGSMPEMPGGSGSMPDMGGGRGGNG